MIKADKYLKETIQEIFESGNRDQNPRPKNSKGEPAHSRFITQKVFEYNISANQFPITTLRTTALKGAFHDIEAIYIKQTNILEEMHPSIHSWWKDFITSNRYRDIERPSNTYYESDLDWKDIKLMNKESLLGKTYGHTIKRYDLMNKLLKGLEENPFGRRHIIDMWQEQQMIDDPKALVPCAFETLWSVREERWVTRSEDGKESYSMDIWDMSNMTSEPLNIRYIDLTLIQRSMDLAVTSSINPAQYVMLGMMVCNHLTFKTGIKHELGKFLHLVQNCHIYEAHLEAAKEILEREPINEQPLIKLNCKPKDFYEHTIDDFEFILPKGIKKLENNLEIMV
jgi:thymidylate synthase